MKLFQAFVKRAALCACVSVFVLSGCAASDGSLAGTAPQRAAAASVHGHSWIASGAKDEDLVYTSSPSSGVTIFSYPKGSPVGKLTSLNYPWGLCSDTQGDVFVVDNIAEQVLEFAHAAVLPERILSDPGADPTDCTWDPTTGDVAVITRHLSPARLDIFSPGTKKRKEYVPQNIDSTGGCAYDSSGNLFIDGDMGATTFHLIELPKGQKKFVDISLPKKDEQQFNAAAMQWDGKYLALMESYGNVRNYIYRLSVSGSAATIVGRTTLQDASDVEPFWTEGGFVATGGEYNAGEVWKYPQGGKVKYYLYTSYNLTGVTVSIAP